jgi:AbrB family looped-hinge helix DNA binding protein
MSIEAKVTSKGQVTLPSELRQRLGIAPGDRLVFVEQPDGSFALRVRGGTLAGLRGVLHDKVTLPESGGIEDWIGEARGRAVAKKADR